MQTSNIRTRTLLWQAAILLLLAGLPAAAQNGSTTDNTSASTAQSAISDSRSAAPSYPPQSERYKSARVALLAGRYDQYVQMLEKAGTDGDMQCQNELGNLYDRGRILPQDHQKAFQIWQELAAKNCGPAIDNLGTMYDAGVGVPKDYKRASELFSQSSALGCDLGTISLAYMYREGHGCKPDYAKTLALCDQLCVQKSPWGWYGKSKLLWQGLGMKADPAQSIILLQQAAEAGLPAAQYLLASRYSDGERIPVNDKFARFWAQRGSDQADIDCQLLLANLKIEGLGGDKDCAGGISLLKELASQFVLEGEHRLGHAYHDGKCGKKDLVAAKMWWEKAAERDYAEAENDLGIMYFQGDGVPKNLEKSFEFYMKAARQDLAPAQYNIGFAYEFGKGVKQDWNQARIWYAKAVVGGNPHACNNLAGIYFHGNGCPANKELAMSLRRQGAKNGCPMACLNLGRDYYNGRNGVPQNIYEAVRLYKKSVELANNPEANSCLGYIYEHGLAGKKDLKIAVGYYREAAKGGNEFAIKRLKDMKYGTTNDRLTSFNTPVTSPKHRSDYVIYDIDPRKARYFIHIPTSYTSSQQFGLIVYISCWDKDDQLPEGWAEVLERRHLLFICPQNAGNKCGCYQRAGLAVLGALEMMRKYNVDKSRVYAAGALGGARIASELGFNQSDVFRGTIQSCGSEFHREVKKLYPTAKETPGDHYGLCEASVAEVADARKKVKFALITGNDDFRRGNVLNIYHDGFAKEGFRAKLFEVGSIGLSDCDGKTLEQALDFIE
jgi:TPR repeat protein